MGREQIDSKAASQRLVGAKSISDFLQQWLDGDFLRGEEWDTFSRYYVSYIDHFGSYIKFHYGAQTRELFGALAQDKSKKILEIGCGCGTESLWVALQGYTVKGIDISDEMLRVARARQGVLEAALGRKLACDFEKRSVLDISGEQYDVIWMEQAFHHLEPRAEVLKKLSALLRPGGRLVICEVNAWNPMLQAVFFKQRGFNTISTDEHGGQVGNERILTAKALGRLLARHGIREERIRYFRFFPNKPWVDWIASRFGVVDDKDIAMLRPLYTHYNYVGAKE